MNAFVIRHCRAAASSFVIAAAAFAAAAESVPQGEGPKPAAAAAEPAPQDKGPKPSMFLVGVAKAGVVDHSPVRGYSGRVLSPETVAVVPQVAGTVMEAPFTEGSIVKKGDVLYRIDDVRYAAAAAAAAATVAQCEATFDYADKAYARTRTLFEKKVASVDDMDSATSARATAEAALAAARAALVSASNDLNHCTVVAPIDGRVGLNAAVPGNYVSTASGALTTIVRQDPARVVFAPSNREFLSFFGGEKGLGDLFEINVRLADGTPYGEAGTLEFVGNQANATTDTMPVYVRLPNPDGLLVPGSTVKIEVRAREPRRLVALPLTAVVHDGDKAFVWMVGENRIPVRRDVVVGPATSSYETILSGLEEGEEVIVRGTHKIIPGVPVEPVAL